MISPNSILGWLQEWADVLGVIGSLILSGLLVLLYRRQQQLLKMERRPIIEVGDYNFEDGTAEILLSNYGEGVATDLELVTAVKFEGTETLKPEKASAPFRRSGEDHRRLERSIRPHQELVRFEADPCIGLDWHPMSERRVGDFRTSTRLMEEEDIEEFYFKLFIRYSNQLDETEIESLFSFPREVELNNPLGFYEAYSNGGMLSRDGLEVEFEIAD